MDYSNKKSIIKAVRFIVLSLLSLLIAGIQIKFPEIFGMSVGGLLMYLYDRLKHNWGVNLP